MSTTTWQITGCENADWNPNSGPDINPKVPDSFTIQKSASGLQIFCQSKSSNPYAGQLAAAVFDLKKQSAQITFNFTVNIDPSISIAEVIETDTKFTDAAGWTYNGSWQWVISRNWMTQVGNWTDTGVEMPLRQGANQISIIYALDYKNHTLNFVAVVVNGKTYNLSLPPIPAQQIGWALSKFVTQLQMCTGANGGCYDLLFTQMSYSGN